MYFLLVAYAIPHYLTGIVFWMIGFAYKAVANRMRIDPDQYRANVVELEFPKWIRIICGDSTNRPLPLVSTSFQIAGVIHTLWVTLNLLSSGAENLGISVDQRLVGTFIITALIVVVTRPRVLSRLKT